MPVEVAVGTDTLLVQMNNGTGSVFVGTQSFEIDPLDWILKSGIAAHTDDDLQKTIDAAAKVLKTL